MNDLFYAVFIESFEIRSQNINKSFIEANHVFDRGKCNIHN